MNLRFPHAAVPLAGLSIAIAACAPPPRGPDVAGSPPLAPPDVPALRAAGAAPVASPPPPPSTPAPLGDDDTRALQRIVDALANASLAVRGSARRGDWATLQDAARSMRAAAASAAVQDARAVACRDDVAAWWADVEARVPTHDAEAFAALDARVDPLLTDVARRCGVRGTVTFPPAEDRAVLGSLVDRAQRDADACLARRHAAPFALRPMRFVVAVDPDGRKTVSPQDVLSATDDAIACTTEALDQATFPAVPRRRAFHVRLNAKAP